MDCAAAVVVVDVVLELMGIVLAMSVVNVRL